MELETASLSLPNVSILYRYGLLAKALKLSVAEVIALKGISNLNPFAPLSADPVKLLADDTPYAQTLRFADVAELVKESGFNLEDLEYLLRHRFDPVGKYRPNPDALLALVKLLAAGIGAIYKEHALPIAVDEINDDMLRQKLALVLPSDMAETFLGMLTGSVEYKASKTLTGADTGLDPKAFSGEAGLRVSFDDVTKLQHLGYRGMLLNAKKEQLIAANPNTPLLVELLNAVQQNGAVTFAKQMDAVLRLLVGTFEYAAVQENVDPNIKLKPHLFANHPALRVSYDEANHTQRLGYRGLLLDVEKEQLSLIDSSMLFATLLNDVQKQARAFFNNLLGASLAMLISAVEFEALEENVLLSSQLDPQAFARVPAIRASYEIVNDGGNGEASGTQRLTCRGMLTQEKRDQVTNVNPSQLLTKLLDAVRSQADAFLKQLRVGLLLANDFKPLFDDLNKLAEISEQSRASLLQAILPSVQQKLIRQLIVQTMATNLNADPVLTEALLTDGLLLSAPTALGKTLLAAFAASGDAGVSASFFTSPEPDSSGNLLKTMTVATASTVGQPNGANSARLEGYLEAVSAGAYRFFLKIDKAGASAQLTFAHLSDPFLRGQAGEDGAEFSQFIELKSGVPYRFTLDANNLGGGDVTLMVQGETLPKGSLDRLMLYPQATVEHIDRAQLLLAKIFQLVQGLALSERESPAPPYAQSGFWRPRPEQNTHTCR